MRRLISFLKNTFVPKKPTPEHSLDELRIVFRKRYALFRSLLTANNNALQAMAELEQLYYGGASYRMAEIRKKITTILVNVYKMVRNLVAMGEGAYRDLEPVFEKISTELEAVVERKPAFRSGPLLLALSECDRHHRELVGDKMARLGELSRLEGIVVPKGFVITAAATRSFLADLTDEINRRLQLIEAHDLDGLYRTCAAIRELIVSAPLPADLEASITDHYQLLVGMTGADCRVALRSSALGEDNRGSSFAGLYSTILNADRETLLSGYREVIAGKYGARAIAYRRRRGYRHEDIEMCVGCMTMVDARFGGVVYTMDPAARINEVLRVHVTSGLAKGVVDGTSASNLLLLSRRPPHLLAAADSPGDGFPGNEAAAAVIGESCLGQLAAAALRIEKLFGGPQDIEWAIDHDGAVCILQSRPLQIDEPEEAPRDRETAKSSGDPPLLSGGVCASRGVCSGRVQRVECDDDIKSFPIGAVLIVSHPLPEWAPLLNQAAGVLAETGSEAGHLATVAREFGIPALFSLPGAMALVDGEQITVHADGRGVYGGRREDLLRNKPVVKDPMAGSPVQRLLGEAMELITPLNLTDPDATQFKPSWCETLHDITRYCHEKSVSAMFDFGRAHHFDEGRAKRLIAEVPLEWWVIDLADGMRQDVAGNGGTVPIGDIASVPMLAIWEGIAAYPWQGPPPVSMRGFGSIIFQSAMRPELDPAVATRMTVKNYFLISKNFCHLSVRLGYHYSLIEAYISDLLTESYVTFRFKGGAADAGRKKERVRLLALVLQHYGFRVEQRADALLARVKKRPAQYLEQRLKILGYLTMHSRQLDMVMDQAGAFNRYQAMFIREIDAMLGQSQTESVGV